MHVRLAASTFLLIGFINNASAYGAGYQHGHKGDSKLLRELIARRELFIQKVAAEGYPACPAPTIVLKDTPSFGNYESARNELVVASWASLTFDERQSFKDMARQIGHHATGISVFSDGTHRWVFVHEMGHWWQTCRKQTRESSFEEENGANRIALSFWRQEDPRFAEGIVMGFKALTQAMPSPIPAGESVQAYVDAHFSEVSHGDTYTWVQATSIVTLADEVPQPSFHDALSQPLFPR